MHPSTNVYWSRPEANKARKLVTPGKQDWRKRKVIILLPSFFAVHLFNKYLFCTCYSRHCGFSSEYGWRGPGLHQLIFLGAGMANGKETYRQTREISTMLRIERAPCSSAQKPHPYCSVPKTTALWTQLSSPRHCTEASYSGLDKRTCRPLGCFSRDGERAFPSPHSGTQTKLGLWRSLPKGNGEDRERQSSALTRKAPSGCWPPATQREPAHPPPPPGTAGSTVLWSQANSK